jgi:hypothetical protein
LRAAAASRIRELRRADDPDTLTFLAGILLDASTMSRDLRFSEGCCGNGGC